MPGLKSKEALWCEVELATGDLKPDRAEGACSMLNHEFTDEQPLLSNPSICQTRI